jgi:hypothetical protein
MQRIDAAASAGQIEIDMTVMPNFYPPQTTFIFTNCSGVFSAARRNTTTLRT